MTIKDTGSTLPHPQRPRDTTYVTGSVSSGIFLMTKCALRSMFTLFSQTLLHKWKSDIPHRMAKVIGPHRMAKVIGSQIMLAEPRDSLYILQTLRCKFCKSSVAATHYAGILCRLKLLVICLLINYFISHVMMSATYTYHIDILFQNHQTFIL
jgi:hypothetical protein